MLVEVPSGIFTKKKLPNGNGIDFLDYSQAQEREEEENEKNTDAILMGNPLLAQQDGGSGIKRRCVYARHFCCESTHW